MSKIYAIRWKSRVNGRVGEGSRRFERDEANTLVAELNEEFPDIDHEVVESSTSPLADDASTQAVSGHDRQEGVPARN